MYSERIHYLDLCMTQKCVPFCIDLVFFVHFPFIHHQITMNETEMNIKHQIIKVFVNLDNYGSLTPSDYLMIPD